MNLKEKMGRSSCISIMVRTGITGVTNMRSTEVSGREIEHIFFLGVLGGTCQVVGLGAMEALVSSRYEYGNSSDIAGDWSDPRGVCSRMGITRCIVDDDSVSFGGSGSGGDGPDEFRIQE